MAFSGGSDRFSSLTLSATSQSISTSTVTLSGAITLGTNLVVTTPHLIVAAGGATLSGTGELILSNTATNSLHGATAAATLTNHGKIFGAGALGGGSMVLVNAAGAIIVGNDSTALTINTGTSTITNAGVIEATGVGTTIIQSAVANTGTLYSSGTLTVNGAVSGAGVARIVGGTADFASTFTENVVFVTSGELELAHSQAYTGTISGFSLTGATSLDLQDITFTAGTTKATYSGTTTSGTLTVTDGTHTAKIKLSGNYTASTFDVSAATGGGTLVIDPTAPVAAHAINPAPPHQFITAMASFESGGGPASVTAEPWRANPSALATPSARISQV